jgi:putative inorganic carbon (HCO3(-)) transporter
VPSTSLPVDRLLVAATVVLTAMVFSRAALDPVNVPKLTVLVLAAAALLATAAYRILRHRIVVLPTAPAAWAAGVLALALVTATVTAPTIAPAVYGAYGRNSGLLAYGCALVLFFAVLRSCARTGVHTIALGVGVAGLLVSSYGMLQWLGVDAIPWNNPFNPIISALGNPNFAAAYVGIAAPVAIGGALWSGWGLGFRLASGFTAALCVGTALLSDAAQGPLAAAAGLAVVGVARVLDLDARTRRVGLGALAAGAGAVLGAVAAGSVLRAGPLSSLFTGISYDARLYYWEAALGMLRDDPVLGVGLDHYGSFWRTARSDQAVAQLGGPSYTDSAHSLPLQMLAQGGLLLGLTYVAFVVLVGVVLVRGLLRLQGQDRLLLGMLGGSWTAYQVQSLVSIDQVPLIVLHFVAAGAVVAAAGAVRPREIRLPGALPVAPPPKNPRGKRQPVVIEPPARDLTGVDAALLSLAGLLALALAWQAFVPLRANVAAKNGVDLMRVGDGTGAFAAYSRAAELVPGLPYPYVRQAELFAGATPPQSEQAEQAYLRAAAAAPQDPNVRLAAAKHAEATGDLDLSRRLLREALALDPLNATTIHAVATFELRHSGAEYARDLLEEKLQQLESVARLPSYAPLWADLGDARAVLRDPAGARTAYEVALFLQPDLEAANRGLQNLDEGQA